MFGALLAALLLAPTAYSLPVNSPLLPSYDYIVVGGGPAGLTVANRLSEDPHVNVLLLEAGPLDAGELSIEIPALIGENIGSVYDWNLSTVAQTYLNGASRNFPQGHGLGGGTLINGMLWNRGGIGDYEAWVQLGNAGWGWWDLLPYFKKSETFTPVSSLNIATQYSIEADPNAHGSDGPVQVSFPNFQWSSSAVLFSALNELGVPTAYDPNNGEIAGASFLPLDLDPETQTRSTARKAYYDPIATRPNLWVSTGQIVTQILFAGADVNANATNTTTQDPSVGQGSSPGVPFGIFGGTTTPNVTRTTNDTQHVGRRHLKASRLSTVWNLMKRAVLPRQSPSVLATPSETLMAIGVEFASSAESVRQNITATREVIVAAGALHSPQLLLLSGIGPAAALQALQIPVNRDLPGVGNNLHDHSQVYCWYPYHNASYSNPTELTHNDTFATEAWADYWANRTGPLTSGAIDGVAFPPMASIMNGSTLIWDTASAQSAGEYLPPGTDATVLAGFAEQLPMLIAALSDPTRAGYEIINGNTGALTVANMRPLSRGTVTLGSSEPFNPPVVDPRYGSNPVDAQVLIAAMRFNERLLTTNSLSQMDPVQISPAPNSTDDDLLHYIEDSLQTEYHPAGTCAMMPLELGGVVDPQLLVYGTANLRVVDSSIIPMLPAAHLQAVVYGIAEKAADIIKAANSNATAASGTTTSSAVATLSATDAPPVAAAEGAGQAPPVGEAVSAPRAPVSTDAPSMAIVLPATNAPLTSPSVPLIGPPSTTEPLSTTAPAVTSESTSVPTPPSTTISLPNPGIEPIPSPPSTPSALLTIQTPSATQPSTLSSPPTTTTLPATSNSLPPQSQTPSPSSAQAASNPGANPGISTLTSFVTIVQTQTIYV